MFDIIKLTPFTFFLARKKNRQMNKYYITLYVGESCQLKTVKIYAHTLTEADFKINGEFPNAIITAIIVTK